MLAQTRTVAITVDDLPYAGDTPEPSKAESVNRKLLDAFHENHVPVTGFVIQQRVEALGTKMGVGVLEQWINGGFDLGNHTYSHADSNELTVEQIKQEILRGESAIGPLMRRAGKRLEFFRFPMNHTGDTAEKHDSIAAFLSQRGYRLATCTIDNEDWVFNEAYLKMLAKNDAAAGQRLRYEYLAYTGLEIDYYSGLNKQVLGYEPPHVMLLHANRLNADVIGQVLQLFEDRKYQFVSLEAAQSGPAYRTPETYANKYGWMWGYRWAKVRNVKVNGSLEPEPPKWISEYGR